MQDDFLNLCERWHFNQCDDSLCKLNCQQFSPLVNDYKLDFYKMQNPAVS